MEPTTPPPERRHRRLIVAFVLVLVSTVAWWFWPRGDARFVGKWQQYRRGESRPYGQMLFFGNGDAVGIAPSGVVAQRTAWTVTGNELTLWSYKPQSNAWLKATAKMYGYFTNRSLFAAPQRAVFILHGTDELHLDNDGEILVWRRIPE